MFNTKGPTCYLLQWNPLIGITVNVNIVITFARNGTDVYDYTQKTSLMKNQQCKSQKSLSQKWKHFQKQRRRLCLLSQWKSLSQVEELQKHQDLRTKINRRRSRRRQQSKPRRPTSRRSRAP